MTHKMQKKRGHLRNEEIGGHNLFLIKKKQIKMKGLIFDKPKETVLARRIC